MNTIKVFIASAMALCATSVLAQTELTVCDGTDNSAYVPFVGFGNMDGDQTSQMIYPADELSSIIGKKITSMVFYPKDAIDWSTNNTWSMGIVDQTAFASANLISAEVTQVAQTPGVYDRDNKTWAISLDDPYTYTGGNLLIQGMMPQDYNGNKTFYGKNQTSTTAVVNYNNMGFGYEVQASKFLAKITFVCEDAEVETELGEVVFSENFESYTDAFTTTAVGDWTYIDGDGWSTYVNPNMGALPHASEAMAYQLIDTSDSRYTAYYTAHSGSKFLMAMGAKDGIVNNDWLISPEQNLALGGQLKFWALGATGYASFEVLASTTGKEIADFTIVGEKVTNLGGSWREFTYELPAGTKYFAIRNVTNCGGWLAIPFSVDDITVNKYVVSTAVSNINAVRPNNDVMYNLQGQRINGAQKGIVIKNGKKYLVK